MPVLHLGVIDIPYVEPNPPARKAPKNPARRRVGPHRAHAAKYQNISTGDVAEILEARYHVFENFYQLHEADIAGDLEHAIAGGLESLLMGAPLTNDVFGTATSKIEDRFKQFLSNKEMDALGYPGVPTAAAEHGVSHRFKQAYKRRAPRPSFIDTAQYQASSKAWVTT